MENQSILKELYPKLVSGEISEKELAWLKAYFDTGNTEEMYGMIRSELDLSDEMFRPTLNERDVLARVHGRIASEKFNNNQEVNRPAVKRLWPRIGIAAAVATIIVSAGIWFYNENIKEKGDRIAFVNDIAPGKQGATLTLASGKKIRLTDAENGELAREAGVTITKTAGGQLIYEIKDENTGSDKINMLTTDKGETYQVRLPDGSSVWLNAASTLKYPASFAKLKSRSVELSGEGYFEIARDKAHPFMVKSNGQEVEVLGTHFNISSYPDEPLTKTTLLEGSVRLNKNTLLKPGEQASLNPAGAISVSLADVDQAVAWKNGKFMFDNESIESIMRKLSRWYNVEVFYSDDVKDQPFTVTISRYDNISKILDKIAFTNTVHFKIEGRRVTVMK